MLRWLRRSTGCLMRCEAMNGSACWCCAIHRSCARCGYGTMKRVSTCKVRKTVTFPIGAVREPTRDKLLPSISYVNATS